MNYDEIINLLKKEKFWIIEAPGFISTTYQFMKGYFHMTDYFSFKGYSIVLLPAWKRYFMQLLNENENSAITEFLHKKYLKDKKYIMKRVDTWKTHAKILQDYCNKITKSNLKNISNKGLVNVYHKFNELYIQNWSISLCLEGTGIYVDTKIAPEIAKVLNVKLSDSNSYITTLSLPLEKSFVEEERIDFLELCIAYHNKNKFFEDMLQKHSRKYFWIRNNYERAIIITPKKFLSQIKEEIKDRGINEIKNELSRFVSSDKNLKKRKKDLIKKLNLPKKYVILFEFLSLLAWWQDQRKKVMLIATHHLFILQKEIARRSKVPLTYLGYTTPSDLNKVTRDNFRLDRKEIEERMQGCVYATYPNGEILIKGEKAKKIFKLIKEMQSSTESELIGTTASIGSGNVTGKVRIVHDPNKMNFKKGEILVASMTRPDFVPLMRKAKGVITNEGGITSHAAIVSRELGIPCIIGTKIATKVLKNNALVEIDTNQGTVKIIKN